MTDFGLATPSNTPRLARLWGNQGIQASAARISIIAGALVPAIILLSITAFLLASMS